MKKTGKQLLFLAVALVLVMVMIYSATRILDITRQQPEESFVSKTITRDGVDYFPRQDITVILVMGIDEMGPVVSSGSYRNTGEVDVVTLLILDEQDRSYSLLCLNRDTMVQMPALGLGGKQAGTAYGQLALSHTYGDGLEISCENTRKTVSDLLYGLRIDHYVAMNMDAIAIVNDAVGGVTVTVEDDFSQVGGTIPMGQVTLNGEQAVTFVRSRQGVGSQMNLSRMQRQQVYMEGFMQSLNKKLDQAESFVISTYEAVSDYMVTDCSSTVISGILNRCSDYTLKQIVSVPGENRMGEEFYEFYPDEQQLDALILQLFYAPK